MANERISEMTNATTPLSGLETVPVVLSSQNYKVTVNNLTAGRDVTMASVTTSAIDFLHKTSAALTDGAQAQTATMTNAPTAGNPSKWIAISDNGVTRYIPAW